MRKLKCFIYILNNVLKPTFYTRFTDGLKIFFRKPGSFENKLAINEF